jgi:hypothetical protein
MLAQELGIAQVNPLEALDRGFRIGEALGRPVVWGEKGQAILHEGRVYGVRVKSSQARGDSRHPVPAGVKDSGTLVSGWRHRPNDTVANLLSGMRTSMNMRA